MTQKTNDDKTGAAGDVANADSLAARFPHRYPYTFAADYLREQVGGDYDKGLISRAAAAQVQQVIADALGIEKRVISEALAAKYIQANAKGGS